MIRRTALWVALALMGIVVTAAIAWAASRLASQRIGLSSEPLSVAAALAPSPPASNQQPARPARPKMHRSRPNGPTSTSPRATPSGAPAPPVAAAPTASSIALPSPAKPSAPSAAPSGQPASASTSKPAAKPSASSQRDDSGRAGSGDSQQRPDD